MKSVIISAFLILAAMDIMAQNPVRVDLDSKDPNETSLVWVRQSAGKLLGASNIDQIYRSDDTGKTWSEFTVSSRYGIYGDPVLRSSDFNRIYFAHLSRTPGKSWPNWFDRIVVQYTDDGGKSFSTGASVGSNGTKMQDKPWLNVDESPKSPFRGRVYVSWTEFDQYESRDPKCKSRIRFACSMDSGKSFLPAVTISDFSGDCLDDDNTTEGAVTASLPDGTICAVWCAFGKIWFDQSKDGGKTWGKDKIIAEQTGGWSVQIPNIYRANGFPNIFSVQAEGKENGRLYVFYGDEKLGDHDIWMLFSSDGGISWSKEFRINQDAAGNGRDQFMGQYVVDPTDGRWYAVFYDMRHGDSLQPDVSLAWSNGDTIYNRRLTPKGFNAPGKKIFFGDYIAVDAYKGQIAALWTEYNKELQLYSLVMNRSQLQPTSSSNLPIYVLMKKCELHIKHQPDIQGFIRMEGKYFGLFKWKKTIEIRSKGVELTFQDIVVPIQKKGIRKVIVDLKVPNSEIRKQSVWYP